VQSQHIVENRILRQLSADELKSIQPWLVPKQLEPNTVLHEQGAEIDHIYFPLSGMISLLAVMQSGDAIETGIVGAEGVLGGDAAINGHLSGQATVQMNGAALMMPKRRFVDAYHRTTLAGPGQPLPVDSPDASAAECCLPRAPFSS